MRCIDAKQRFPFRQRSHYELRLNAVAVRFIGLQRYRAIAHAGSKQKGRVTRSVAFLRCEAQHIPSKASQVAQLHQSNERRIAMTMQLCGYLAGRHRSE